MVFPLITGILLDRFTNGYAIIFGFCSIAYIIAFFVNNMLAPNYQPVRIESDIQASENAVQRR